MHKTNKVKTKPRTRKNSRKSTNDPFDSDEDISINNLDVHKSYLKPIDQDEDKLIFNKDENGNKSQSKETNRNNNSYKHCDKNNDEQKKSICKIMETIVKLQETVQRLNGGDAKLDNKVPALSPLITVESKSKQSRSKSKLVKKEKTDKSQEASNKITETISKLDERAEKINEKSDEFDLKIQNLDTFSNKYVLLENFEKSHNNKENNITATNKTSTIKEVKASKIEKFKKKKEKSRKEQTNCKITRGEIFDIPADKSLFLQNLTDTATQATGKRKKPISTDKNSQKVVKLEQSDIKSDIKKGKSHSQVSNSASTSDIYTEESSQHSQESTSKTSDKTKLDGKVDKMSRSIPKLKDDVANPREKLHFSLVPGNKGIAPEFGTPNRIVDKASLSKNISPSQELRSEIIQTTYPINYMGNDSNDKADTALSIDTRKRKSMETSEISPMLKKKKDSSLIEIDTLSLTFITISSNDEDEKYVTKAEFIKKLNARKEESKIINKSSQHNLPEDEDADTEVRICDIVNSDRNDKSISISEKETIDFTVDLDLSSGFGFKFCNDGETKLVSKLEPQILYASMHSEDNQFETCISLDDVALTSVISTVSIVFTNNQCHESYNVIEPDVRNDSVLKHCHLDQLEEYISDLFHLDEPFEFGGDFNTITLYKSMEDDDNLELYASTVKTSPLTLQSPSATNHSDDTASMYDNSLQKASKKNQTLVVDEFFNTSLPKQRHSHGVDSLIQNNSFLMDKCNFMDNVLEDFENNGISVDDKLNISNFLFSANIKEHTSDESNRSIMSHESISDRPTQQYRKLNRFSFESECSLHIKSESEPDNITQLYSSPDHQFKSETDDELSNETSFENYNVKKLKLLDKGCNQVVPEQQKNTEIVQMSSNTSADSCMNKATVEAVTDNKSFAIITVPSQNELELENLTVNKIKNQAATSTTGNSYSSTYNQVIDEPAQPKLDNSSSSTGPKINNRQLKSKSAISVVTNLQINYHEVPLKALKLSPNICPRNNDLTGKITPLSTSTIAQATVHEKQAEAVTSVRATNSNPQIPVVLSSISPKTNDPRQSKISTSLTSVYSQINNQETQAKFVTSNYRINNKQQQPRAVISRTSNNTKIDDHQLQSKVISSQTEVIQTANQGHITQSTSTDLNNESILFRLELPQTNNDLETQNVIVSLCNESDIESAVLTKQQSNTDQRSPVKPSMPLLESTAEFNCHRELLKVKDTPVEKVTVPEFGYTTKPKISDSVQERHSSNMHNSDNYATSIVSESINTTNESHNQHLISQATTNVLSNKPSSKIKAKVFTDLIAREDIITIDNLQANYARDGGKNITLPSLMNNNPKESNARTLVDIGTENELSNLKTVSVNDSVAPLMDSSKSIPLANSEDQFRNNSKKRNVNNIIRENTKSRNTLRTYRRVSSENSLKILGCNPDVSEGPENSKASGALDIISQPTNPSLQISHVLQPNMNCNQEQSASGQTEITNINRRNSEGNQNINKAIGNHHVPAAVTQNPSFNRNATVSSENNSTLPPVSRPSMQFIAQSSMQSIPQPSMPFIAQSSMLSIPKPSTQSTSTALSYVSVNSIPADTNRNQGTIISVATTNSIVPNNPTFYRDGFAISTPNVNLNANTAPIRPQINQRLISSNVHSLQEYYKLIECLTEKIYCVIYQTKAFEAYFKVINRMKNFREHISGNGATPSMARQHVVNDFSLQLLKDVKQLHFSPVDNNVPKAADILTRTFMNLESFKIPSVSSLLHVIEHVQILIKPNRKDFLDIPLLNTICFLCCEFYHPQFTSFSRLDLTNLSSSYKRFYYFYCLSKNFVTQTSNEQRNLTTTNNNQSMQLATVAPQTATPHSIPQYSRIVTNTSNTIPVMGVQAYRQPSSVPIRREPLPPFNTLNIPRNSVNSQVTPRVLPIRHPVHTGIPHSACQPRPVPVSNPLQQYHTSNLQPTPHLVQRHSIPPNRTTFSVEVTPTLIEPQQNVQRQDSNSQSALPVFQPACIASSTSPLNWLADAASVCPCNNCCITAASQTANFKHLPQLNHSSSPQVNRNLLPPYQTHPRYPVQSGSAFQSTYPVATKHLTVATSTSLPTSSQQQSSFSRTHPQSLGSGQLTYCYVPTNNTNHPLRHNNSNIPNYHVPNTSTLTAPPQPQPLPLKPSAAVQPIQHKYPQPFTASMTSYSLSPTHLFPNPNLAAMVQKKPYAIPLEVPLNLRKSRESVDDDSDDCRLIICDNDDSNSTNEDDV